MDTDLTRAPCADTLHLVIAGMGVTLEMASLDAAVRQQLVEHYAKFAIGGGSMPACVVSLHVEPGAPFMALPSTGDLPQPYQPQVVARGNAIEFSAYQEQGSMDFDTGRGWLTLRPGNSPENFLRAVYGRLCAARGGMLLHASGVIRQGRGYVFFGPSGAGKSTIAMLSQASCMEGTPTTILSDDMVIITRDGSDFRVHGVPFRGSIPDAARTNASAPLCGAFVPIQAPDHQLVRATPADAVARLITCIPFLKGDKAALACSAQICLQLEIAVPVWYLHFSKDPGFWRLIDAIH